MRSSIASDGVRNDTAAEGRNSNSSNEAEFFENDSEPRRAITPTDSTDTVTSNTIVPDLTDFPVPVKRTHVEMSPQGRYLRFDEKLGSGQYKTVYRAYDTSEGIEVAWNTVNITLLPYPEKKRIMNEVWLLQNLEHKNLVQFHGSWLNKKKEQVIFVTEIVVNGSLKDFINKVEVIRWKVVKRWMRQILRGLEYLHTRDAPIIHRDLKCDNIFINGHTGDIRIGDLGLSTAGVRTDKNMSVLGTPEFMAPELYDEFYDEKVDIYAFGMCMLEMITKERPYNECTNAAQIYKRVVQGILPSSLQRVQLRTAVDFIRLCLDFDPDRRPSATQLLLHPFLTESNDNEDNLEIRLGPPPKEGDPPMFAHWGSRHMIDDTVVDPHLPDVAHPVKRGSISLATIAEFASRDRIDSSTSSPDDGDDSGIQHSTYVERTEVSTGYSSNNLSPVGPGLEAQYLASNRGRMFSFGGGVESTISSAIDGDGASIEAVPSDGESDMDEEHESLLRSMPNWEANMRNFVLPEGREKKHPDGEDSIPPVRSSMNSRPASLISQKSAHKINQVVGSQASTLSPTFSKSLKQGHSSTFMNGDATGQSAVTKGHLPVFKSIPESFNGDYSKLDQSSQTLSRPQSQAGFSDWGSRGSGSNLNMGLGMGDEEVLLEGDEDSCSENDCGTDGLDIHIDYAKHQGKDRNIIQLILHTQIDNVLNEVEFPFNIERERAEDVASEMISELCLPSHEYNPILKSIKAIVEQARKRNIGYVNRHTNVTVSSRSPSYYQKELLSNCTHSDVSFTGNRKIPTNGVHRTLLVPPGIAQESPEPSLSNFPVLPNDSIFANSDKMDVLDSSESDLELGEEHIQVREAYRKRLRQAQKAYETRQASLRKALDECIEENRRMQEKFRKDCEEFNRKKLRLQADYEIRMLEFRKEWQRIGSDRRRNRNDPTQQKFDKSTTQIKSISPRSAKCTEDVDGASISSEPIQQWVEAVNCSFLPEASVDSSLSAAYQVPLIMVPEAPSTVAPRPEGKGASYPLV